MIDAAIDQRRQFFDEKRERLYRIEIFYAVVLEGQWSKIGFMAALKRLPTDPKGAVGELKAQVAGHAMKVLLRKQIDADASKLQSHIQNFVHQLSDFMRIETLGQQDQFTFFRRLLNFDDWRIAGRPKATQFLDYQVVVNSDVAAERDHLRVGDHLRAASHHEGGGCRDPADGLGPVAQDRCQLSCRHRMDASLDSEARKEVTARRRHFNMAKSGFFSQMCEEKRSERDQLIDDRSRPTSSNWGIVCGLWVTRTAWGSCRSPSCSTALGWVAALHAPSRQENASVGGWRRAFLHRPERLSALYRRRGFGREQHPAVPARKRSRRSHRRAAHGDVLQHRHLRLSMDRHQPQAAAAQGQAATDRRLQLLAANAESLGDKRKELSPEHIDEITRIFCEFQEVRRPSADGTVVPISLIFPNGSFGYRTITVERPLRDEAG